MLLTIITLISPAMAALVLLCIVIKNWNKIEHNNLKKYIFPLASIFGVYGYSMFFNGKESDLTRYYDLVKLMDGYSLKQVFLRDTEFLYTRDILFHFTSLTKDVNMLAFFVGFIIYAIVFYVLFDTIKKSKRDFKTYEMFLLGIISVGIISPYTIICNVRCVLAYSIITLAIYRDLVQKKKNILTYLLYIIPLGLHSSAIIIIVIRVLSALLKKLNKISLIIALMLPTIIDFIHEHIRFGFGSIGQMLNNAINKSYYYLHWTEGGWASEIESSVSNVVFRFAGALFLIAIVSIILFTNYSKTKDNKKIIIKEPMINFLFFVAIVALGTLSIKTGAFWRFEAIVVLFSPIIFVKLLEENSNFTKILNYFYVFGVMLLFINVAYQIRNLTEYGYIITLYNFVSTSFIKIIYKILIGLIHI